MPGAAGSALKSDNTRDLPVRETGQGPGSTIAFAKPGSLSLVRDDASAANHERRAQSPGPKAPSWNPPDSLPDSRAVIGRQFRGDHVPEWGASPAR